MADAGRFVVNASLNRITVHRDAAGARVYREWVAENIASLIGVDPATEVAAQRIAAERGLAPAVLDFDATARVMSMSFVEGATLEVDWMLRPARCAAMQELLEKLRGIRVLQLPKIDPAERLGVLHARLGTLDASRAATLAAQVDQALEAWWRAGGESRDDVLVHGDLSPANIIVRNDESLSLIDWEYAHRGDVDEDLAGLAVQIEEESAAWRLLESWSRRPAVFATRVRLRRQLDTVWHALAAAASAGATSSFLGDASG